MVTSSTTRVISTPMLSMRVMTPAPASGPSSGSSTGVPPVIARGSHIGDGVGLPEADPAGGGGRGRGDGPSVPHDHPERTVIRAWPSPGGQDSGMMTTARRPGGWCGARVPIPRPPKGAISSGRGQAWQRRPTSSSAVAPRGAELIGLRHDDGTAQRGPCSWCASRRRLWRRAALVSYAAASAHSGGACGLRPVPERRAAGSSRQHRRLTHVCGSSSN